MLVGNDRSSYTLLTFLIIELKLSTHIVNGRTIVEMLLFFTLKTPTNLFKSTKCFDDQDKNLPKPVHYQSDPFGVCSWSCFQILEEKVMLLQEQSLLLAAPAAT